MSYYVLDACAIIAFINDEEGAEVIEEILLGAAKKENKVIINKINLLEIYYNFSREYESETLKEAYRRILALPMEINDLLNDSLFYEAARLKAIYRISLADSIALAEASVRKAELVTSDHHEFDVVETKEVIGFHWFR
ncbi:MAG: type II toxin-antitoxin system VapC family toxin [bacterium]